MLDSIIVLVLLEVIFSKFYLYRDDNLGIIVFVFLMTGYGSSMLLYDANHHPQINNRNLDL